MKAPSKAAVSRGPPPAAVSLTLSPTELLPQPQNRKKGGPRKAEDSDTDPDAPVAQMLSFVMDDPDFESEASDTPRIVKVKTRYTSWIAPLALYPQLLFWPSQDTFPVRDELLSDLSDDEVQVEKVTEVLKPTIISFKHKDDTDLFGLGIQDEASATRDSSEEQEGKMKNTPGEKKN